jgi:hypothetical protein
MRFYKLDEVPISRDDVVFKESPLRSAIAAVLFLAVAVATLGCAIAKWPHGAPVAFLYVFGAFFALFALGAVFNFRATLKPTNWLLRCQIGAVFIHYRAYENWRLPGDTPQVVGLEYGEIAWARLVKEQRKSPSTDGKGGTQFQWFTYIDFGMTNPKLAELEANLQAERGLRPNTGMKVVTLDYPVQVLPGGIVEIRWNAGMRPSAKKALAVIGQRVKILETEHRKTDLTHHAGANPEEEKAKIIALARSGDHFAAVKLAQQAYGYNLNQAHEFVNGLVPDGFDDETSRPTP